MATSPSGHFKLGTISTSRRCRPEPLRQAAPRLPQVVRQIVWVRRSARPTDHGLSIPALLGRARRLACTCATMAVIQVGTCSARLPGMGDGAYLDRATIHSHCCSPGQMPRATTVDDCAHPSENRTYSAAGRSVAIRRCLPRHRIRIPRQCTGPASKPSSNSATSSSSPAAVGEVVYLRDVAARWSWVPSRTRCASCWLRRPAVGIPGLFSSSPAPMPCSWSASVRNTMAELARPSPKVSPTRSLTPYSVFSCAVPSTTPGGNAVSSCSPASCWLWSGPADMARQRRSTVRSPHRHRGRPPPNMAVSAAPRVSINSLTLFGLVLATGTSWTMWRLWSSRMSTQIEDGLAPRRLRTPRWAR